MVSKHFILTILVLSYLAGAQAQPIACVDAFDGRITKNAQDEKAEKRVDFIASVYKSEITAVGLEASTSQFGSMKPTSEELKLITAQLRRVGRLFELTAPLQSEVYIRFSDLSYAWRDISMIALAPKSNKAGERIPNTGILTHEFSHIAFLQALKVRISALMGRPGILFRKDQLDAEIFDANNEGLKPDARSLLEREEIGTYIAEKERITHVRADLDSLNTLSLEELFSDFVTAVFLDRPSAMSRSLIAENKDFWPEAKFRDFGKSIGAKGWTGHNEYHLYTPVRSYLGKRMATPLSLREKQILIRDVFNALTDEILELNQKSEEITPEELNNRLIKKLSRLS